MNEGPLDALRKIQALEKWISRLHDNDLYRGWFLRGILQSIISDPEGWEREYSALAARPVEGKKK